MTKKNGKPSTRTIYLSAPKNTKWNMRKKKIPKARKKLVVLEEIKQVCTTCGGDHWSPDCPQTASMMQDKELQARATMEKALHYIRKLGFSPQLEISQPAPKRQAITTQAIYMRPLDGSDKLTCSCCACAYEKRLDAFRGTLPIPLNWCDACRELLRSAGASVGYVLYQHEQQREGKAAEIQRSVDRINKAIEKYNAH